MKRSKKKIPKEPRRKEETKLLTRLEIAEAFNVMPGTITRWERDGMPIAKRAPRGQASLFDLAAVTRWRTAVTALEEGQEESLSLNDERAKLAEKQREKIELDLSVRRGQLVEREAVVLAGQAYTKGWTAKVRALPRQLVQAGLVARENEAAVAALCRELLSEIAGWRLPDDEGPPEDGS